MTLLEACAVCGHELVQDPYASQGDRYDHYRCPSCREGGIHDPHSGRRLGPIFDGHTPIASIAHDTTHDTQPEFSL